MVVGGTILFTNIITPMEPAMRFVSWRNVGKAPNKGSADRAVEELLKS